MPRPQVKRHRSNQKSPKNKVATNSKSNARLLLERRLSNKPIGERPVDSDDSDRLVTRRGGSKSRSNSPRGEVFASGAVAKGDRPGAYPTRAQRRQHLRSDTKQVIAENRIRDAQSRSATASKSTSPFPAKSPLSHVQLNDEPIRSSTPLNSISVQQLTTKPTPLDSQRSLPGETSILGTLKPRRRQASILHLIENEESSIINSGDEEQFLPDNESTPLHTAHITKSPPLSRSSASASRKRKLGSDGPVRQATTREASSPDIVRDSLPASRETSVQQSAEPLSGRSKRIRPTTANDEEEDEIMAPPQSSSPEPEPEPERAISPVTSKRKPPKPIALSTKDLQTMMPSKPRKGNRQRRPLNEFDIPADSSSDPIDDGDEESAFVPQRQPNKSQRKGQISKSKSAASKTTPLRAKAGNRSKSTAPATPRPSSIRTPLPLTRSINAENRKLRSPLPQQQTTHPKKQLFRDQGRSSKQNGEPAKQTENTNAKQQSGGSYLLASTTSQRVTRRSKAIAEEAANDKENLNHQSPSSSRKDHLVAGSLSRNSGAKPKFIANGRSISPSPNDVETLLTPSIERSNDMIEVEEVGRGGDGGEGEGKKSKAARSWNNVWADIDNWEMEFEEVSVDTGSSSPGRR